MALTDLYEGHGDSVTKKNSAVVVLLILFALVRCHVTACCIILLTNMLCCVNILISGKLDLSQQVFSCIHIWDLQKWCLALQI